MWSRAELKSNAKNVLKKNYWMAFAVCLVAIIAIGAPLYILSLFISLLFLVCKINADPINFAIILSMVCLIFFGYPVGVGKTLFFLSNREKNARFSVLFSVFKAKHYFNIVKTMFLSLLFTCLWSLVLVIPGVIKAYQYFMIPYILAENPSVSSKRAFEISKAMTKGHKFKIFVLGLSFIGWNLLGTLCCCVGTYFVYPYTEATLAELYANRREAVLASGDADMTELCGINLNTEY